MSQQVSFLVAFATVFGMAEAIRSVQAQTRRKEHRSRKNNLLVHCPKSSQFSPVLDGRLVVLSGDKLYIDTGTRYDVPFGHPFAGYYLPFPDTPYEGLVTTICDGPAPIMNWIYIDAATHEVKFGTRPWAEANYNGPFDCTRQDRRLTLGSWEGFYAVKEPSGFWALYFDLDDDGLVSKLQSPQPAEPAAEFADAAESPVTSAEIDLAAWLTAIASAEGAQDKAQDAQKQVTPEDENEEAEDGQEQAERDEVSSPGPVAPPDPTPHRAGPAIPVNLLRIEMRVAKPVPELPSPSETQDKEARAKEDQNQDAGETETHECTDADSGIGSSKRESRAASVEDELESPEVD